MAGELDYSLLPHVNAALNATCALLLVAGYAAIRGARAVELHKACMIAALAVSVAFLASYLVYHAHAGSRRFEGPASVRPVYLAILLTHTVLAAAVPFLAARTAWLGFKDDRPRHVRLARITLPIWLYVSVTGVVVYGMLYHLYPGPPHP
jgi:uncharacterized membrane protein YozB (DUF420 family)